ncbi:hypothetical protein V3C33_02360 [Micrococcaceae bacterium Sec5.7]
MQLGETGKPWTEAEVALTVDTYGGKDRSRFGATKPGRCALSRAAG